MKTIEIVYYNNEKPQFAENSEFQEIPETFEELKELCEGIKGVEITSKKTIKIKCFSSWVEGIQFDVNGVVRELYGYQAIAVDRTPQQMLQIIKNLVEE